MNQLFVFTGARGTGKSTLAATYMPPSKLRQVYCQDSEYGMGRIRQQFAKNGLDFGYYVALPDRFKNLPGNEDLLERINAGVLPWVSDKEKDALADYYLHCLNDLAHNLIPGQYDVFIHDTLEKLEAGMQAWVEKHKRQAGVSSVAYGKLWTEGVFPLYEALLTAVWQRGVKTIILTSHLRTPWEGNRPVLGKVAPGGKRILFHWSSLFLWLVNDFSNADGAPAAIVLKERMGNLDTAGDHWRLRRMLPVRIPHCTWQDVNRYLREGCDLAHPAPDESMSAEEEEMISEILSDMQLRLMVLDAQREVELLRAGNVPILRDRANPEEQARRLFSDGWDLERIAQEVGRPPALVRSWLSMEEEMAAESEAL